MIVWISVCAEKGYVCLANPPGINKDKKQNNNEQSCRCLPTSLTGNIQSKWGVVKIANNLDFIRLLTFSSVLCLIRPAGDNRHPQPSQMNKSCGNAPWQTPGSGEVLALSWVHFCSVFTWSRWPCSHLKFVRVCLHCSCYCFCAKEAKTHRKSLVVGGGAVDKTRVRFPLWHTNVSPSKTLYP